MTDQPKPILEKPIRDLVLHTVDPVYCQVVFNNNEQGRDVTIEGWLVATVDQCDWIMIQPSIAYRPNGVLISIDDSTVISITPAYVPQPFDQDTALKEFYARRHYDGAMAWNAATNEL
jgi:hypothetical protein